MSAKLKQLIIKITYENNVAAALSSIPHIFCRIRKQYFFNIKSNK